MPAVSSTTRPVVDNLESGEYIYQRFVLVTGTIAGFTPNETTAPYIAVDAPSFPRVTFPISPTTGAWKALVHLQPGPQALTFSFNGEPDNATTVTNIAYLPLLHVPPLHLAIMVAKDSQQRMDCPPEKAATPTHNDLEAAKKKMRTWAYMCQAFTAEEMRKNGFGRRSFRLDEEWAQDTLSTVDDDPTFRVTAKIHVVKTEHTMAQLRDPHRAQQNPNANQSGALYDIFHEALKSYGGPFQVFSGEGEGPVVAGHIFDSHFNPKLNLITAHAALGGTGGPHSKVHLGMFGSHTHWAWPRNIEEIVPALLDATRVTSRSLVGNDNGECGTFWETCCIGQGAALHEVGHAFGLPHQTSGIMRRGYVDWNRSFVAKESYNARRKSPAAPTVPAETENHWHLADMLHLATHHMFALPGDEPPKPRAPISARPHLEHVTVSSPAGIAHVAWTRNDRLLKQEDMRAQKPTALDFKFDDVHREFDPPVNEKAGEAVVEKSAQKLSVTIIAGDGAQKVINDFWEYSSSSFVPLPNCDFAVNKKSVVSGPPEGSHGSWAWAVLLSKLNSSGDVVKAIKIVVHKGLWFDGLYIHYDDGSVETTGPKVQANGQRRQLGGNPTAIHLRSGESITHAYVSAGEPYGFVNKVKLYKDAEGKDDRYEELRPDVGEVIVGFYGKNQHDDGFCPTIEFGILTIPDGGVLPKEAYSMSPLLNTDGGSGVTPKNAGGVVARRLSVDEDEEDEEDDEEDNDDEMDED
ncbi:hypothetical protein FA95DRAFT_1552769 [Auriscalpium vulgare]|uniref:Uncharacterized protein n=1 Tax=Auriscalpium vulgare TaxID=40419 RepID=A0ACB8SAQ5_9AGAM|nr:hypothetical protein FA95DRAFT_1552769 [Auriscalpium vulgare]